MAPDYDLSNLPASQADLWLFLKIEAILGQIMADQAERFGLSLVLEDATVTAKPQSRLNRV